VTLTLEQGDYFGLDARSSVDVTVDGNRDTCTVEGTGEQLAGAAVSNTCRYEAPEGASLVVANPSNGAYQATCNGAQTRLPCRFGMPAGGASADVVFSRPVG
jgi:hypothetical protein